MFYWIIQTGARASTTAPSWHDLDSSAGRVEGKSDLSTCKTVESWPEHKVWSIPAPSSDVRTGVRASRTASERRDSSPRPHLGPLRQPPRKFPHVSLSHSTCAGDLLFSRRWFMTVARWDGSVWERRPPFCLHYKWSSVKTFWQVARTSSTGTMLLFVAATRTGFFGPRSTANKIFAIWQVLIDFSTLLIVLSCWNVDTHSNIEKRLS